MLAVATTDALVLLPPPTLKNPPSSLPPSATFLAQPSATAWATDNTSLFLALPDAIEKYDSTGTHLDTVYSASDPVTALVAKDKGNTLLFSVGNEVLVFDVHARKVAHRFTSHRHDVVGLTLSSDASLLAAISSNAVHVYNLSLASHTILRGFPTGPINTCAFHPHTRTRLLLGIGHHLAIYDTSRTSGPAKTCTLEKGAGDIVAITSSPYSKTLVALASTSGNVCLVDLEKDPMIFRTVSLRVSLTSLVFSPEGAGLYAGTDDGKILMLDLRGLDKTPKSISVSETNQKVVCMAVQKKPKSTPKPVDKDKDADGSKKLSGVRRTLSNSTSTPTGSPTIKKTASSSSLTQGKGKSPASPASTRPRTSVPPVATRVRTKSNPTAVSPGTASTLGTVNPASPKRSPVPVRTRTMSSTTTTSGSSRFTASSRTTATSRTSVSSATAGPGKPFSPPRSPLGQSNAEGDVSVQVENLLGLPKSRARRAVGSGSRMDADDGAMLSTASRTSASASTANPARVRTRATATRNSGGRVSGSTRTTRTTLAASNTLPPSGASGGGTIAPSVSTALPSTSVPTDGPVSTTAAARAPSRPTHRKMASSASSISIPQVSASPVETRGRGEGVSMEHEQLTEIKLKLMSRTPSPEAMAPRLGLAKGALAKGKEKERERGGWKDREKQRQKDMAKDAAKLDVLGLGTPEVERWVAAGALSSDDEPDAPDAQRPRGRRVGFLEPESEPEREVEIRSIEVEEGDAGGMQHLTADGGGAGAGREEDGPQTRTIKMTVQFSPRRPPAQGLATSPLRAQTQPLPLPALNFPTVAGAGAGSGSAGDGTGGGQGPNPAHDLLHALIRDALHDFRRETKAEIVGLHLDLVRMGRGWRKEMEQWAGEMREVVEENRRLREENERLRRGY